MTTVLIRTSSHPIPQSNSPQLPFLPLHPSTYINPLPVANNTAKKSEEAFADRLIDWSLMLWDRPRRGRSSFWVWFSLLLFLSFVWLCSFTVVFSVPDFDEQFFFFSKSVLRCVFFVFWSLNWGNACVVVLIVRANVCDSMICAWLLVESCCLWLFGYGAVWNG